MTTTKTTSMPLHPQVQAFIRAADPRRSKIYELDPQAARAQVASVVALIGPGPAVATARDIAIAVRDATIPARVYAPERSLGTVLWFHGGGWVIGDLDTHDALCRTLANAAQCTVVSVAYRRAQEHRFPVALDDCWDALRWAAAAHPCTPLVVGGDSAGGNLAAVCALRARDRGEPALALQVLVYPVTDHDMTTDSYIERGSDDALMGKRSMQCDRANPEASPLRAPAASQDGTPVALDVTAWTRGRADSHR